MGPLQNALISWPALVVGKVIGQPDAVGAILGAWLPVLLGVMTVAGVYFIARELNLGAWAYFAAAVPAFMPTEFYHRTWLGLADHHALEAALMTATVLTILKKRWAAGGVCLGLFAWAWNGAMILFGIIALSQLVDRLRGRGSDAMILTPVIAGVMSLVLSGLFPYLMAPALFSAGWFMAFAGLPLSRRDWYRVSARVGALGLMGYGLYLVMPLAVGNVTDYPFISEARHLEFTDIVIWYGLVYPASVAGLIFAIKARHTLMIIWGVVLLGGAIAEVRYGYYFALSMGVFGAWALSRLPTFRPAFLNIIIAVVMIGVNLPITYRMANETERLDGETVAALLWLKDNGAADGYVMSHWDYGSWIIGISGKKVVTTPCDRAWELSARWQLDGSLPPGLVRYAIVHDWDFSGRYGAVQYITRNPRPLQASFIWRLWFEGAPGYTLKYQGGAIKIWEIGS
jgi:asparagine N-glycosylation enzyme membrane subunit Stt3